MENAKLNSYKLNSYRCELMKEVKNSRFWMETPGLSSGIQVFAGTASNTIWSGSNGTSAISQSLEKIDLWKLEFYLLDKIQKGVPSGPTVHQEVSVIVEVVRRMRAAREGMSPLGMSVKDLVEKGRER